MINSKNDYIQFAQSCSSRDCKSKHRDIYEKKNNCDPTTPHILDKINSEITCLYCKKKTKI